MTSLIASFCKPRSLDDLCQNHLKYCLKRRFLGPAMEAMTKNLWRWGLGVCFLNKDHRKGSCTYESLQTTIKELASTSELQFLHLNILAPTPPPPTLKFKCTTTASSFEQP